jgi:hypothetical protein
MRRIHRSAQLELERVYGHEIALRLAEAADLRDQRLRGNSFGLLATGCAPEPPGWEHWQRAALGLSRVARRDGFECQALDRLRLLLGRPAEDWPQASSLLETALECAPRLSQRTQLGTRLLARRQAPAGRGALVAVLEEEPGEQTLGQASLGLAAWALLVGENDLCGALLTGLRARCRLTRLMQLRALALSLCAGAEGPASELLAELEVGPRRSASATERRWLAAFATARADESASAAVEAWPSPATKLREWLRAHSRTTTSRSPLGALCRALLPG